MAPMKPALPPLTKDMLDAFIASAWLCLLWAARVIAQFAAPRRGRRLHRIVARLERGVESILFLRAVHRFGPMPRRTRIPRAAPPGFRRQRHARLALFFRNSGVRARKANYAQRIASLVAALANPEPHVAYFFKRIARGLRGARLIAIAPPATALGVDPPHAAICVDSS